MGDFFIAILHHVLWPAGRTEFDFGTPDDPGHRIRVRCTVVLRHRPKITAAIRDRPSPSSPSPDLFGGSSGGHLAALAWIRWPGRACPCKGGGRAMTAKRGTSILRRVGISRLRLSRGSREDPPIPFLLAR